MKASFLYIHTALILCGCFPLYAEQDAGGGFSGTGTVTNWCSIGSAVETQPSSADNYLIRPEQIQIRFYSEVQNPDANGNQLPDEWESYYFPDQNVDPNGDLDNDGTSNLMEYLAGTVPTDSSSVFRPDPIMSGRNFTLPIHTMSGRIYQVWVSKDLKNWHLQQTFTGDGTQKLFSFDHASITDGPFFPPTNPSNYFFRIGIILE